MAKTFKVGIVVGSAVGNALAGLGSVSSSLKILTSNTMDAQSKIQALEKNNKDLGGNLVKEFAKVGAAVGAVAYPAIRMESAMAEVNKVVDFEDENGLDRLKNSLLEMSREIPMAANQLAEITASGGRLGVAEKDLLSYTETVAKIGIAFDMTAGEAGQLMAELSNVYKIPINELDVLGDTINYLSNSFATTPQAVATAMKSFAGGAQSFGLTEKHAAAIATALTSLGISGDVAGTSMRNMLQILNTPEKQSESFKKAFATMGFSIKEFKQATAIDAEGAFLDLFERLGEMPREMRAGLSFDLFGQSNADLANQLGSNFTDTLSRTFAMVGEKNADGTIGYLGSMEEEFQKMKATTWNNIIILKNNIEELSIVIGEKLLPPINDAINAFRPMIVSTIEWAQANPELIQTGLKVIGVFFGMKLGLLATRLAIAVVISNFYKFFVLLKSGLGITWTVLSFFGKAIPIMASFGAVLAGKLLAGIKLVTTAVLFLGKALLMNPVGLIITGIAVAALLIYTYWEPIKEFFIGIWNTITEAFDGGIGSITALIINWSPLGLFYKAFAGILGWFGVELPSDFTEFGSNILSSFLDGLVSIWDSITGFFSGLWSEVTTAFDGGIGDVSKLIINWSPLGLFYQAFAEVLSWFGVELPESFTQFGSVILTNFLGGLSAAWGSVKRFFKNIWRSITSAFSGGITGVSRLIINWSPLGLFYKAFAGVMSWFGVELPADFVEFGSRILSGFVDGLSSMWGAVTGFFSSLWDRITTAFDGGIAGIGALIIEWSPLVLFAQAFDAVFRWFEIDLPAKFMGFGQDIITGLTDGISSMMGAVKDSIVNVGSSITGWFADILGIRSPSRVFIGHGADITAGAAIGITRGLPEARKAIDGLSDEMTLKPQRYQSLRSTFEAVNAERAEAESPIIIHYSPQITVESGSKDGIQEALKLSVKELEKMLDKLLRDRARRAY